MKGSLSVLVICALGLTCVLAQDSGRPTARPGRGNQDKDKDRQPRTPPKEVCYLGDDSSAPAATKALLKKVVDGEESPEMLLVLLKDIPTVCLRFLKTKFMEYQSNCTHSATIDAVCTACKDQEDCTPRRAHEMLGAVMPCLVQGNICEFLKAMITTNAECIPVELTGPLASDALDRDCSLTNIPACAMLQLEADDLKEELKKLDSTELVTFLQGLDPHFAKLVPCNKVQTIAEIVEEKDLFDFSSPILDLSSYMHLFPLMPFLDEDVCSAIPKDIVQLLLGEIKDIDFMCGDNKKKQRGRGRGGRGDGGMSDISDMDIEKIKDHFKGKPNEQTCGIDEKDVGHIRKMLQQNQENMRCMFKCGQALVNKLTEGDNPAYNITSSVQREALGKLAKCLPKDKLLDGVMPGQCKDIGSDVVPEDDQSRYDLAKKCRPNKEAKDWTREDLENLGCTVTDLGNSDIRRIPKDVLCGAINADDSALTNCLNEVDDIPAGRLNGMMRRCFGGQALSVENVKKLGRAAASAACEDIKKSTPEAREAIMDALAAGTDEVDMGRARCFKVDDLPLKKVLQVRGMAAGMSLKAFRGKSGTSKADIIKNLGLDTDSMPELSMAQKLAAFRILKGTKATKDITLADLDEMKNVATALDSKQLGEFNKGERRSILDKIARYSDLTPDQIQALAEALVEAFADFSPENPLLELGEMAVDNMDDFALVGLGDHVENMTEEVCKKVCYRLGQALQLRRLHGPRRRMSIAGKCLKCLGHDNNAGLTDEQLETLGQLVAELDVDILDKTDGKKLKKTAYLFSKLRCMKPDIAKKIQDKISAAVTSSDTEEDLVNLGAFALGLPKDKRDSLKEKLSMVTEYLTSALASEESDEWCERTMTDADKEKVQEDIQARLVAAREASEQGTANRRRRAVEQFTCAQLLGLGDALSAITVEQIEALDNTEMLECIGTLGAVKDWKKEQSAALLMKYKTARSLTNFCNLTSLELQNLGSISYGFTADDVGCLDNLDIDALAILGALGDWSDDHKKAFAARFLAIKNSNTATALTGDEIAALGNFVCGLSVENIKKIEPAAFVGAIRVLRELECSKESLKEMALLAKHQDALGPISGWSSAEWNELGVIVAGLTPDELKGASSSVIEQGWTALAVKHMQAEHIKALSAEQIGALNADKAYYLNCKADGLSKEQVEAIQMARAKDGSEPSCDVDDGGSGNTSGGAIARAGVAGFLLVALSLLM